MAQAGTPADPAALSSPVQQAWFAAGLFAIDPAWLGGIVLHAGAGPVRDRWLADLRACLPETVPWRRLPLHADAERLLGGIDLAATLQQGRPVAQRGLLAESGGGVVLVAMAERAEAATVALVAATLDRGEVSCARDGIETCEPARFGIVALDESADDDARVGEALLDRCAFHVDLRGIAWGELATLSVAPARADIAAARVRYPAVDAGDAMIEALCAAAHALGVASMRACLYAVRVARLAAAMDGRDTVASEDAALAARLVLAPRATRLPAAAGSPDDDSDEAQPEESRDADDASPEATRDDAGDDTDDVDDRSTAPLEDQVLAAAAAAIPAGLLARLAALGTSSRSRAAAGRAGALQKSRSRGRPAGSRRDRPRAGARLDLIATLRAAVPWQRMRGRVSDASGAPGPLRIRVDDFHVGRFQQRSRTTTIFAVDASGSSALHRLAEAKGAVELLLADCYVRRDSVAVLGFRGRSAELLLPPTRSLVRARRSLAELPGGGGTPLAAGIDAARELALLVRRRGETPVVVVLSDGRANVARDGSPGRPRAEAEALLAARLLRKDGVTALFIDTSAQPHPSARELAEGMGARYLPLPHAEAATLSSAVRGAAMQRDRGR